MGIQVLPPFLARQIAAGECIERPASIVKELLENSLDAGATNIEIVIEEGGTRLIRITDNGSGITKEDLPLALQSHATSKIRDVDDLSHIHTLGFRGEALASISSVAEVMIASVVEGQDGYTIYSKGKEVSEVSPFALDKGTIIEVKNLFFSIPARRKFLKSKSVEMGHITDIVTRLSLAYPQVAIRLQHGSRQNFWLSEGHTPLERIQEILKVGETDFYAVNIEEGHLKLKAFIADPSYHRGNNKWQFFFLNNRCVRDRIALKALEDAYRDYLPQKRYPIALLYLTMPADGVDVNVHPTKSEVRYQDGQEIYRFVYKNIRSTLRDHDLTSNLHLEPKTSWLPTKTTNNSFDFTSEVSSFSTAESSPQPGTFPKSSYQITPGMRESIGDLAPVVSRTKILPTLEEYSEESYSETIPSVPVKDNLWETCQKLDLDNIKYMTLQKSYILIEISEGLLMIDQHALHERILYDRLKRQMEEQKLIHQPLLFADELALSPEDLEEAKQRKSSLEQIGFKIDFAANNNTLLIHGVPQIFSSFSPSSLLQKLLEQIRLGGSAKIKESFHDQLAMMACKAAIKAGDYLTSEEIIGLLKYIKETQNPFRCPHGRPTILKLTIAEIEKFFYRR